MTRLLEKPIETKLLPPPSMEVSYEGVKRARDESVITKLGWDALEGMDPEKVAAVEAAARSLSKPQLH